MDIFLMHFLLLSFFSFFSLSLSFCLSLFLSFTSELCMILIQINKNLAVNLPLNMDTERSLPGIRGEKIHLTGKQ